MIKGLSAFAVLGASLLTQTLAHNIQMGAHQRECFHEQLHKDDKMTVTFQVGDREFGGAGNLEIDFWVSKWSFGGERQIALDGDRIDQSLKSNTFAARYSRNTLLT